MSVNDYYIGSEMSVLSADKFAHDFIDTNRHTELRYMGTKWWDYRVMHPTHATLYFYHLYNQIAAQYIGKHVSTKKGASYARFAQTKDLRKQPIAVIKAFWKARLAADAIGVPYDVYIHTALSNFYGAYNLFKSTKTGKQLQPYPQQLVSDIIVDKVVIEWEERKRAKLHIPESELILHQDVWFRQQMEASLRRDAALTMYPEDYIDDAIRCGAITSPD